MKAHLLVEESFNVHTDTFDRVRNGQEFSKAGKDYVKTACDEAYCLDNGTTYHFDPWEIVTVRNETKRTQERMRP